MGDKQFGGKSQLGTFVNAFKFLPKYWNPRNWAVDHRHDSINDLKPLIDDYDFFILDVDAYLHESHAKEREPEHEKIFQMLVNKAEVVSNSRLSRYDEITDIFAPMPVSKAVNFKGFGKTVYLLRAETDEKGERNLRIYEYNPNIRFFGKATYEKGTLKNVTKDFSGFTSDDISLHLKKPDPRIIMPIYHINVKNRIIPENPKILMAGDLYTTDIICGNLAHKKIKHATIDTAIAKPFHPENDFKGTIIVHKISDPIGNYFMSPTGNLGKYLQKKLFFK